jgi:hypothetical protein
MCLFLLREFDAETVAQAFAKGQGTVTWFVPTMSRRVIDFAQARNLPVHAFDSLRLIVSASPTPSASPFRAPTAARRNRRYRDITLETLAGETAPSRWSAARKK